MLRVKPVIAELWDGPASKAVAIYEFAKASAHRRGTQSRRELQSDGADVVSLRHAEPPARSSAVRSWSASSSSAPIKANAARSRRTSSASRSGSRRRWDAFAGEQIYRDGRWYKIRGFLNRDGRLHISGERKASWSMDLGETIPKPTLAEVSQDFLGVWVSAPNNQSDGYDCRRADWAL